MAGGSAVGRARAAGLGRAGAVSSSFGGSNRHVVDYLTEVVLDSVDSDIRRFLLETSILRELSGPQCDAVTGRHQSAAMLDMLERSNLFVVSLDDQRLRYRYHHLFGELLREQLTLTMPERVADLHRAAAGWSADAGHVDDAIRHAIAAQDLHGAANLVVRGWGAGRAGWPAHHGAGVARRIPSGYVSGSASLSVVSAWANGLLGDEAAARRSIADVLATEARELLPDGSGTAEQAATLMRSMFAWTDVRELRSAARSVQRFRAELCPDLQAVAAFAVGLGAFLGGDHEEALAELRRAVELASAHGDLGHRGRRTRIQRPGRPDPEPHRRRGSLRARRRAGGSGPRSARPSTRGLPPGDRRRRHRALRPARGRRRPPRQRYQPARRPHADPGRTCPADARTGTAATRRPDGRARPARRSEGPPAQCTDTGTIGDLVPEVARGLAASHRRGERWTGLTDRELSVLRLLHKGRSQREIAQELFLSFHTVHSHTKSIYTRLGVSSRDEAIERARELELPIGA